MFVNRVGNDSTTVLYSLCYVCMYSKTTNVYSKLSPALYPDQPTSNTTYPLSSLKAEIMREFPYGAVLR